MLIKSQYKDILCDLCYSNHLSILFSEVKLDGEEYLNITYGSVFLKPILKKKGIEFFD